MLRLYDSLSSGNGYKVRLLLHQLGQPFERIEIDLYNGESRTPEFLKINPNGRIPVLAFEDGRVLAESNAILFYLACDTTFLPDERWQRAEVLQWMFFEQYTHEPNIAVARSWLMHPETGQSGKALRAKQEAGYKALDVMEGHLGARHFFAAKRYTVADIALYAYTHVAHEGGFDLERFPAIRAWLARVLAQPGYVPITKS